jgi:hypothetical protein
MLDQNIKNNFNSKMFQTKFTNCIYVLSHPTAYIFLNKKALKIGSSKCLPHRMLKNVRYCKDVK